MDTMIVEGRSISKPPYFDGTTNCTEWKERIKIFIQSVDFDLWLVIKNGPKIPKKIIHGEELEKSEDEFNDEDKKIMEREAKAKNILYCALNPDDLRRISSCHTAKEMWEELDKEVTTSDIHPLPSSSPQISPPGVQIMPASFLLNNMPNPEFLEEQRNDSFLNLCVPIYKHALHGNWRAAKHILDNENRLKNAAITNGYPTLLHIAAGANHIHFVKELLKMLDENDITLQDKIGNTAFCYAAAAGNIEIVDLLLDRNSQLPVKRAGNGYTPIQYAALQGRSKMTWHLYDKTTPCFQDEDWKLLFFACIYTGIYDFALKLARDRNELAFVRDVNEETALHLLARNLMVLDYRPEHVQIHITKRKIVTVAWKKICAPYEEGGLNLRSLVCLNEATNLKLCWDLLLSEEHWAKILKSRVLRGTSCINHHIYSSIWSGIKMEFQVIRENSSWLVGDGKKINFWFDHWCGDSLFQILNATNDLIAPFPSSVNSYISNNQWSIPQSLTQVFPSLRNLVHQVTLPMHDQDDGLVWKHNPTGTLSLKDAFEFKRKHLPKLNWTKSIWSSDIPPSKSLLAWRLMHDKLPTDENLSLRGCSLPSMCSLCLSCFETSYHLFLQCPYAKNIWRWFASILNINLQIQNFEDIWKICSRNWNPQCKLTITAAIINILNAIWYARNQQRFQDKKIHWKSSISTIISNVSLSSNLSQTVASSSITDFIIMKKFNVSIHPPKAPRIIEVVWHPPIFDWIKCNTDGAATNVSSSCGGIFRNKDSMFLLCFAENTGIGSAYHAELSGAMRAIEIAARHHWNFLWLESDSALVVNAFKNHSLIPWRLRNRWNNCLHIVSSINFMVTHVYREGNCCADALANIGLTLDHLTIWLDMPACIRGYYVQNRLGLPGFRFVNF
ncbi:putative ribonuclease H-like domain, ankyrin repeat-containing domain-containing protein [Medicago truncatula]|uniref:Putative ribonuclease H-like domain, ankyrin repeat-containing domain-containing protein n=1 Tax=Medicago truncatula TaxID=3880 RepID=A0A396JAQ4_MEDTR|nr:putative ribonuclease H-like domain, ankyrin repeat-containing domain-containing protein [Medicago truncatula]